MELVEVGAVLKQLKGAAFHVMALMRFMKRPCTPEELSKITKYSLPTVRSSLGELEFSGFVAYDPRDDAWSATALSNAQLAWLNDTAILVEDYVVDESPEESTQIYEGGHHAGIPAVREIKNFSVSCSRRSSIYNSLELNKQKQPPQQHPPPKPPPKAVKKQKKPRPARQHSLPDDPDVKQACDILVGTGVPYNSAVAAIRAALKAEWGGTKIFGAVVGWLDYAASDRGETIKHPGFLAARRLKTLQLPPVVVPVREVDAMSPERYTSGKFGHLIKH